MVVRVSSPGHFFFGANLERMLEVIGFLPQQKAGPYAGLANCGGVKNFSSTYRPGPEGEALPEPEVPGLEPGFDVPGFEPGFEVPGFVDPGLVVRDW